MTEPQTWTTIGVLAAALLGTITLVSSLLTRSIGGQITSLRNEMVSGQTSLHNEMVSGFDGVRSEVGGLRTEMNARFETVDVRFDAVNARLDGLDRDVQALVDRGFRRDRP